jgi:hypothetical protein
MFDFLLQAFEQRLVAVLEGSRYAELDAADRPRILRSVEAALGAPSLAQGARELLSLLDDRPDLEALAAAEEGDVNDAMVP